jgi:hypothetical protein
VYFKLGADCQHYHKQHSPNQRGNGSEHAESFLEGAGKIIAIVVSDVADEVCGSAGVGDFEFEFEARGIDDEQIAGRRGVGGRGDRAFRVRADELRGGAATTREKKKGEKEEESKMGLLG